MKVWLLCRRASNAVVCVIKWFVSDTRDVKCEMPKGGSDMLMYRHRWHNSLKWANFTITVAREYDRR